MIRAYLHPDGYTVRLDATDAAEHLLDLVALAFAEDGQHVGKLLRTLAAAAQHHQARRADPSTTDYGLDSAGAARDTARDAARHGLRSALLRLRRRGRRLALVQQRQAALLDQLPPLDGLLAVDLSHRTATALGDRLRALAAQTVAGRRAIELEHEK
ncbi:hypothetical protein [Kitasatospora sp. GP82]|uniref:hypothetical protein n=1 Tax=Kitasatospora sp. GP82 TaxID=3035089 RepID=UPI0024734C17|nr:hypothetical protein [Kitasatospora sp. GP82]MDH6123419.1 hypothetical protein [Kitasatospora sp. GP82]